MARKSKRIEKVAIREQVWMDLAEAKDRFEAVQIQSAKIDGLKRELATLKGQVATLNRRIQEATWDLSILIAAASKAAVKLAEEGANDDLQS